MQRWRRTRWDPTQTRFANFVHNPNFYANLVTDSRTRFELKLLALYVAGKPSDDKARILVGAFDVARSLDGKEWWGGPIIPMLRERDAPKPEA
jgi:hypothetical protein